FHAGLFQILQDHGQASGVRGVSGKAAIIDWHVAIQGVDYYFQGLWKGQMFFVPPVMDICQRVSVAGTACGIDSTNLIVVESACPQTQERHAILLCNGLGKPCNIRRREWLCPWCFCYALPGSQ